MSSDSLAAATAAGKAPPPVAVPVGFTTFPGEIWAAPRSWVDAVYPGLAYFNEVDRARALVCLPQLWRALYEAITWSL